MMENTEQSELYTVTAEKYFDGYMNDSGYIDDKS